MPLDTTELFAEILGLRQSYESSRARDILPSPRTARFAGWTLDLVTRQLRTPNGAVVHVRGTEFALLIAFLGYPWQLLTRDQLVAHMRRTTPSISQRTLNVYVSRLRQRLRAHISGATLVATRHTHGYVFNADAVFE